MSKSKGNVIDPLELIDEYGADALRFTLAAMAAQGRDIKLSTQRVEGYRNFATKLWNACRFAEMNDCATVPGFDPASVHGDAQPLDRAARPTAVGDVTEAIAAYRFNDAAAAVYHFVWDTFCDWYVELAKPVLQRRRRGGQGRDAGDDRLGAATRSCKLLHPFMPFITEELWRVTAEAGPARASLLALAPWPVRGPQFGEATEEINWVIDLVTKIRSVRAEMNVPAATQIPLVLGGRARENPGVAFRLRRGHQAPRAGVVDRDAQTRRRRPRAQIVTADALACLPLQGIIDFAAEKARLAEGDGAGRKPTSPASTPSSPTPISSPARRRRWSTASARSARRRRRAGARSRRRWSGSSVRREAVASFSSLPRREGSCCAPTTSVPTRSISFRAGSFCASCLPRVR